MQESNNDSNWECSLSEDEQKKLRVLRESAKNITIEAPSPIVLTKLIEQSAKQNRGSKIRTVSTLLSWNVISKIKLVFRDVFEIHYIKRVMVLSGVLAVSVIGVEHKLTNMEMEKILQVNRLLEERLLQENNLLYRDIGTLGELYFLDIQLQEAKTHEAKIKILQKRKELIANLTVNSLRRNHANSI
ncbi:hypothetical protein [Thalassotalea hakodatensis]|uniref:hypothetical protein n=1 Tax=Thalassotalea hakodatensis TaxID=3030492 RepID=UPI0025739E37|nr:hypothetical protein [Thalassotalea hakodatensis]